MFVKAFASYKNCASIFLLSVSLWGPWALAKTDSIASSPSEVVDSETHCETLMNGDEDFTLALELIANEEYKKFAQLSRSMKISEERWYTVLRLLYKTDPEIMFETLPYLPVSPEFLHNVYSELKFQGNYTNYESKIGFIDLDDLPHDRRIIYMAAMRRYFGPDYAINFDELSIRERLHIAMADLDVLERDEFYEGTLEEYKLTGKGAKGEQREYLKSLARKYPNVISDSLAKYGEDSAYYRPIQRLSLDTRTLIFNYLALEESIHKKGLIDFNKEDPYEDFRNSSEFFSFEDFNLDYLSYFNPTIDQIEQAYAHALLTHIGDKFRIRINSDRTRELIKPMSPDQMRRIAIFVIDNLPYKYLSLEGEKFENFILAQFGGIFGVSRSPEIAEAIMRRDPLTQILSSWNINRGDLLGLNFDSTEESELTIKRVFEGFSDRYPQALSEGLPQLFWDVTRDAQVVRNLIRYYYDHLPQRAPPYRRNFLEMTPKDSIELFCHITGIEYEDFKGTKLAQRPTDFFKVVLALQAPLNYPIFSDIDIDPQLFDEKRKLMLLLQDLQNLVNLTENSEATLEEQLARFKINRLTLDNTDKISRKIRKRVLKKFKDLFEDYDFNPDTITYEQFMEVLEGWGDIDPILTLASRFKGKPKWRDELPVLFEVFRSVIDGEFESFKFDQNDNHLAFLDYNQFEEWKKDRYRLGLVGQSSLLKQEALEHIRAIYQSNLFPHVTGGIGGNLLFDEQIRQQRDLTQFVQREVFLTIPRYLESEIEEPLINQSLERSLESADQSLEQEKLLALYAAESLLQIEGLISEEQSGVPRELKGALELLKEILQHKALPQSDEELTQQAIADIEDINKYIQDSLDMEVTSQPKGIILSVLSSDAKELLTIGDAVDCSSCQNYLTGGMIGALLGYVIDANIRALFSFHIKQNHFEIANDYNDVVRRLRTGQPIQVQWNGNKKTATFSWSVGEDLVSLSTKPLGKAHLRNIVRLGVVRRPYTAHPGYVKERDYAQNHPNLSQMQEYHEAILKELKQATNAKEGLAHFRKSRNPGGVYSDSASGIMTEGYKIHTQ